jgi:hypothetical protein
MMELMIVWTMIESWLEVGRQSIVLLVGGHRIRKPCSGLGADEDRSCRSSRADEDLLARRGSVISCGSSRADEDLLARRGPVISCGCSRDDEDLLARRGLLFRAEAAGPTRTYKPNGDLLFAYRTTLHNRRSEDCLSAADTFLTSATTRQLAAAARPTRRFPFKFCNVFFSSSFTPVWTQRSSKRTSAVLSSNNNN